MSKQAIRIIAAVLAGIMLLSTIAALVFAQEESPLSITEVVGAEKEAVLNSYLFDSGAENGIKSFLKCYDDNDIVDVIIELEGAPVLDETEIYENADSLSMSKSAKALDSTLIKSQNDFVKNVGEKVLNENVEVKYNYTYVFNGIALSVPYGKIDEIAEMDGVKNIYFDKKHTVAFPKTENSIDMSGVAEINQWGSSNYGISTAIGIIDTGIDTDHEVFSVMPRLSKYKKATVENILANNELNAEKAMSSLTVDDVYYNGKLPFVFDYAQKDTDVNHNDKNGIISDHGTHVSAIVAGHAEKEDGGLIFAGVAPYAQLLVFKVFTVNSEGEAEGAASDVFAAMEDSVLLGLDVVNMSIGWNGGLTDYTGNEELEPMNRIIERIESAGTVFVCAAGNESGSGYGNTWGANKNILENIDNGTVSAPAASKGVISVASINNSKRYGNIFRVMINGSNLNVEYTDGVGASVAFDSLARTEKYEYEYCGYGSKDEISSTVSGKIALMQRGNDIQFSEKINNAAKAGAIGAVIFNNEKGDLRASVEGISIPCAFISLANGQKLRDNSGEKKISVTDRTMYIDYEDGATMASTSSWGVPSDLSLKPDVAAPGGNIYSALDPSVSGEKYGMMSGTSMASPHVAGAVALLKKHYSSTMKTMSQTEFAAFVKSQLISTAQPAKDSRSVYYSPRLQGAGVINTYSAGLARLIVTVKGNDLPKAELGDDPEKKGVYTIEFTVKNNMDNEGTFKVTTNVLIDMIEKNKYLAQQSNDITRFTEVKTNVGETFTLQPDEEKDIKVTITLNDTIRYSLEEYINGAYIDGFIRVVSTDTRPEYGYTIPFLTFYGDWDKAPMFEDADYMDMLSGSDKKASTTYPNAAITTRSDKETVFYVGQNPVWGDEAGYISDYNTLSPNGDGYYDNLELYINLMRSAKRLNLEIKNKKTGEIYYEDTQYALSKAMYSMTDGVILPYLPFADTDKQPWDCTDKSGKTLANETECVVTVTAALARDEYNPKDNANDTWSFPLTIDTEAPEIMVAYINENDGKKELVVKAKDNMYVADMLVCDTTKNMNQIARKSYNSEWRETITEIRTDVTNNYKDLYIVVTDYAWNQVVYRVGVTNSIKIDQSESSVRKGEAITFTATFYSDNGYGYNESIIWTTSDESIATIDYAGDAIAHNVGDVVITATGSVSGASDSVILHVVDPSAVITPKPGEGIKLTEESSYTMSEEYVEEVAPQTKVSEFVQHFENSNTLTVLDKNGEKKDASDKVATGDRVCIIAEDGTVVKQRTIVIKGDVTGDGAVNSRDIAALQKHIMDSQKLTGAYLLAADVRNDGAINSRDIASVQKTLLG